MAVLIFVALCARRLGDPAAAGRLRSEVLFVHKSFGVTVLALVVATRRRSAARRRAALRRRSGSLVTRSASEAGHLALYALMIAVPVSGYVTLRGRRAQVSWFGLVPGSAIVGR